MAKPENTAYQIMADFEKCDKSKYIHATDGPVALDPSCVSMGQAGRWRTANTATLKATLLRFDYPQKGHITFGYKNAEKLLSKVRAAAKKQFKKKDRPSFYLRKMTMSEFIAHPEFERYKKNTIVQGLFKKYLLLDLMK